MRPTIQLDTTKFNQVMREYARWNKRDWADIVNAKALDVAFRALKETPKASVSEIRQLESKEWWPKYVAKRIAKGVSFRKGKAKLNFQGEGFTRQDARQVSKAIIAARSRSVAFVKSGWLWGIRDLWRIVKDKVFARGGTGGVRAIGQPKGSARPAVAGDNPAALIINSAIGVEKVGVAPLQRAVDGAAVDMASYIARKMEERARKVAR